MGFFKTDDAAKASEMWTKLTQDNNGGAAAFLAVTNALSKTTLDLGGGRTMNPLEMVSSISTLKFDRIEGTIDKTSFDQWTGAGKGGFSIALKDGKTEKGNVKFSKTDGYGSVHDGYGRQGYTSANTNFQRIQWNWRKSDYGIDIEIDAYKPWIAFPIVWNPKHKGNPANSDMRLSYSLYKEKFGNPGFSVREIKQKR